MLRSLSRIVSPPDRYGYQIWSVSSSVSSPVRMSSSPAKMNSACHSETYRSSDDLPILQETPKYRSSSTLPLDESKQRRRRISISPDPILKHLGLSGHCNSVSSNGDKPSSVETTLQGASFKGNLCSLKRSGLSSDLDPNHDAEPPSHLVASVSGSKIKESINGSSCTDKTSEDTTKNFCEEQQHQVSITENNVDRTRTNELSLPTSFGKQKASGVTRLNCGPANLKYQVANCKQKNHGPKSLPPIPFDIFQSENENPILTEVVFLKDEERDSKMHQLDDGDRQRVLRPGMVFLKGYLTHNEQVSIVKECRHLGLGPGGFYQPGYKDGAKLRLMMMCLGLDWDPQSRNYSKRRKVDNSRPPDIPQEFHAIVRRAVIDSQALTVKKYEGSNMENILPMISPDICIVNFYSTTGRLGLHQDRDESRESLNKGLPVVSISIGDSAEFLYGDKRDISKAEKVVLDSGDVLIFGGESRHIFHGVESIIPDSAPEALLRETGLRPGRLNLTFRQY